MISRKYKITACDVPPSARPGRTSLYREIVDEFLEKGISAGRVEAPGHKTTNVAAGLASAVKSMGAPLKVRRRGENIYLERTSS
ncbi:MAG: hypothetical protein R2826_10695 [Thermoleophilia bacterium]